MGGEQNHKQMAGKSRLRAHVVFPRDPKGPSFLTLADLVTIMHNESQDYRLLSVSVVTHAALSKLLF